MSSQKGLGRGLGALLGDFSADMNADSAQQGTTSLPLQRIEPNPLQPRKQFDDENLQALSDSIVEHGIIQPLTVREMDNGYYQIIAGERRWRAARLAGLQEIPVVVIEADDQKAMELALIENLQRQDLNPIEEALGYQSLLNDFGMTQEQAANCVGKSRPAVANALRLLTLSEDVQQMLSDGTLSAGHAKAILMLKSAKLQSMAAQRVVNLQLSVRQTETLCKNMAKDPKPEPENNPFEVDYIAECEKSLSKVLNRGVKIVKGKKKGRFELEFYDEDDLQRLLEALQTMQI